MVKDRDKGDLIRETGPREYAEKIYTYADYLTWDDDRRYELIDGMVYDMSPAPGRRHQEINIELGRQFATYLLDKKCKIYVAPFDVRLPDRKEADADEEIITVVQPDVAVVCDLDKLDERGCKGAPDLIIEIISPYSGLRDRKTKRDLYEKHGVKEYWIVDFAQKTVEVYLLNRDNRYAKSAIFAAGDRLPVGIFDDLEIDLELVFREF